MCVNTFVHRVFVEGDVADQRLDADCDQLLPDLQKYVDEDNECFEAELLAWDCEQRKKTSRASDVGAGDVSTTGSYLFILFTIESAPVYLSTLRPPSVLATLSGFVLFGNPINTMSFRPDFPSLS